MALVIMWTFVALWLIGLVNVVSVVGKPRKPITPNLAAGMTVIIAAEVAAALHVIGQL